MYSMLSVAVFGACVTGVVCVGHDEDIAMLQMPSMSKSQSLTVQPEVAPEIVFSFAANNKDKAAKCLDDQRLFKTNPEEPITFQECFEMCAANADCKHFSYGDEGEVCQGCRSLEGDKRWTKSEREVFTYTLYQVELVAEDQLWNCPDTQRPVRFPNLGGPTPSDITLQQCFDKCASNRLCNYFSYQNTDDDQNLCIGFFNRWKKFCQEDFEGNTYLMPLGFRFQLVFREAQQGYENRACGDQFQLQLKLDEEQLTLQQCSKRCSYSEDCDNFSYGNQGQVCLGCSSLQTTSFPGEPETSSDALLYTMHQVEFLQAEGTCSTNERAFTTSEVSTFQECFEECAEDQTCKHFSYDANQICVGCKSLDSDNLEDFDVDGGTYSMPVAFDTVFSLAEGFERAQCSGFNKLFKNLDSEDPISFQECFQKCEAFSYGVDEQCNAFSYGVNIGGGNVCNGCTGLWDELDWPSETSVFSYTLDRVEDDEQRR